MKISRLSPGSVGAARALLVRAISVGASFLLTVLVARLLSVEAAGAFFLVFTSLAIAATFGRFGTDNLALKQCGGDTENLRTELGYSVMLVISAGMVAAVAFWAVAVFVFPGVAGVDSAIIPFVATAIIPLSLSVLAGAVLRGRGRLGLGVFAELGSVPSFTILALSLASLAWEADLNLALTSYVVAAWITLAWAAPFAIFSVRTSSLAPNQLRPVRMASFLRSRLASLSMMMGTSLLFYVLTWMPVYALTFTNSLTEVSYYNVAARLANLVALVPILQVGYLAPSFARYFQMKDISALNALASRAAKQASAVLILPILLLAVGAHWIVTFLYGPEYAPAAIPLAILAASAFIVVVIGQVSQLMLVCDLEWFALVLNAVLVLLWVSVGVLVVANFAAIGAAWFSFVTTATYSVLSSLKLRSAKGIRSYVQFRPRSWKTGIVS